MNIDFFQSDRTVEDVTEVLHKLVREKYYVTDASQIFDAFQFACSVHAKQFRGANTPFIIHPMRVALMLVHFERNVTSKVFIAALLHDVLEDTPVTKAMIEERFGKYVAKLVQAVTRLDKTEPLQEKQEAKRQNWEEVILNDHEVRAIKTFEDLDNILCWKTIPPEHPVQQKLPRWIKEAREMSLPLAHATNLQAYQVMQQEYLYHASQNYSAQPITV